MSISPHSTPEQSMWARHLMRCVHRKTQSSPVGGKVLSAARPHSVIAELPDRVTADSIVNRLANNARIINLGQIDMRRHRDDQARVQKCYWE